MRNYTCCFSGHRQIPTIEFDFIKNKTESVVLSLIENGVVNFICGGAVGYDALCAEIVLRLKQSYDKIQLILALPCKNQSKYYSAEQKETYNNIVLKADKVIYTSESYFNGCMHKRNRFMVDNSLYIISYCTRNAGGSFYTVSYAKLNNLIVISI